MEIARLPLEEEDRVVALILAAGAERKAENEAEEARHQERQAAWKLDLFRRLLASIGLPNEVDQPRLLIRDILLMLDEDLGVESSGRLVALPKCSQCGEHKPTNRYGAGWLTYVFSISDIEPLLASEEKSTCFACKQKDAPEVSDSLCTSSLEYRLRQVLRELLEE